MKNFIKSFRLTLVFCVFFSVCYILVLWIFAQFAGPNSGNAEVVELNGLSLFVPDGSNRGHEIRHSEKVLHRILLLGRLINDFDFQSMVRK